MSEELPEFDLATQGSVRYDGRFLRPSELANNPNPMMPMLDAIGTRRTSRAYAKRKVPPETFAWIVRQAMHAPTACNEQQWKIVRIDDTSVMQDLYERGSAAFLRKAPHCFLLCYNARSDNREWLDHVQSGAAFITMFQLVAHTVGIGSCWIGHLPNKSELSRVFGLHAAYEPIALVSYGYYRGNTKVMPRKHDVSHVIMDGTFRKDDLNFKGQRRTLVRTVGRWMYYKIPPPIRRKLRDKTKPYEKKFYYETFD